MLLLISTAALALVLTLSVTHAVGTTMGRISERGSVGLKRRPAEVVSVFWIVLKADEVGVFVANQITLDQEKVLLLHQLFKDGLVNGASHSNEQLRVL